MIEDIDMNSPEDYEFPYIYNNPCRGLLSRRTKNKSPAIYVTMKDVIEVKGDIINSENHRSPKSVQFSATKDGVTTQGSQKSIVKLTGVYKEKINRALTGKESFKENGYIIKKVYVSEIYASVWDGETHHENVDLNTSPFLRDIMVTAQHKAVLEAREGKVILAKGWLVSKYKKLTRVNALDYVKTLTDDGKRLYFNNIDKTITNTKIGFSASYINSKLKLYGFIENNGVSVYRGKKCLK